jgi:hypothetical protein
MIRIVILSPGLDLGGGVLQSFKPVHVQTFIAEASVERFDRRVVRRLRLGQVCTGSRDIKCRRIPHTHQNTRMHWAVKNRWGKAWKEEVQIESLPKRLELKLGGLPLQRPQITLTFFRAQEMDHDGMRGAGKVIIDGPKENGGIGIIRDDSPAHIPGPVHRQEGVRHRDEEHVEILIEAPAVAA